MKIVSLTVNQPDFDQRLFLRTTPMQDSKVLTDVRPANNVLPVSIVCGLGIGLLCRYLMRDTRPIIRTIIYAGIIALSAAGWAFALRAEFGWTPCLIAGVAALSAGLLLYFTKKRALVNLLALTLVLSP